MSIISASDFKGEYLIPNRTEPAVAENINWFISKYEVMFLELILGADLYAEFIAGLAVQPDPDEKWLTLSSKLKLSILSYVYWYIRANGVSDTTQSLSEGRGQAENYIAVSPDRKMMERWNEMVDNNAKTVNYIAANPDLYGIYKPDWTYYINVIIPSTYRGLNRQRLPDIFVKQQITF